MTALTTADREALAAQIARETCAKHYEMLGGNSDYIYRIRVGAEPDGGRVGLAMRAALAMFDALRNKPAEPSPEPERLRLEDVKPGSGRNLTAEERGHMAEAARRSGVVVDAIRPSPGSQRRETEAGGDHADLIARLRRTSPMARIAKDFDGVLARAADALTAQAEEIARLRGENDRERLEAVRTVAAVEARADRLAERLNAYKLAVNEAFGLAYRIWDRLEDYRDPDARAALAATEGGA